MTSFFKYAKKWLNMIKHPLKSLENPAMAYPILALILLCHAILKSDTFISFGGFLFVSLFYLFDFLRFISISNQPATEWVSKIKINTKGTQWFCLLILLFFFEFTRMLASILFVLEAVSLITPLKSYAGFLVSKRRFRFAFGMIANVYFWLLTHATYSLFERAAYGNIPDVLGNNLLMGRADIDMNVLLNEAWISNGKGYTYFGVFPAFLRIGLNGIFPDLFGSWSRLSCLTAALLTLFIIAILLYRTLLKTNMPSGLKETSFYALLFGFALGSPFFFLLSSAYLYHEVILWGFFGAVAVINILFDEERSRQNPFWSLFLICLFSSISLLSRTTFGAPLVGIAFLYAVKVAYEVSPKKWIKLLGSLMPVILAIGFSAFYNHMRFGSIFSAYPLNSYINFIHDDPRWIPATFDWTRIPLAVKNYFGFHKACFTSVFPFFDSLPGASFAFGQNYIEYILPFAVGSPWMLTLASMGFWHLWFSRNDAILIKCAFYGFLTEAGLILAFFYQTLRYQTDFLPLLILLSLFYLNRLKTDQKGWPLTLKTGLLIVLVIFSSIATIATTFSVSANNWGVPAPFRHQINTVFDQINTKMNIR